MLVKVVKKSFGVPIVLTYEDAIHTWTDSKTKEFCVLMKDRKPVAIPMHQIESIDYV